MTTIEKIIRNRVAVFKKSSQQKHQVKAKGIKGTKEKTTDKAQRNFQENSILFPSTKQKTFLLVPVIAFYILFSLLKNLIEKKILGRILRLNMIK